MTVEEAAVAIEAAAAWSISSSLSDVLAAGALDPRSAVLYVFGGAGPLHLVQAAQQAGIGRIRTFPFGSAFSAFGCTVVDVRHQYETAWYGQSPGSDEVIATSRSLHARAVGDVRGEGFSIGSASVRLLAFGKDGVQVASSESLGADRGDVLDVAAESLIGEIEDWGRVETLSLEISVPVSDHVEPPPRIRSARSSPSVDSRDVFWGNDPLHTGVFRWEDLPVDERVEGPALVVQQDATHAVAPGWVFEIDEFGNGDWCLLNGP
jgi:N-methylhydantoinase A